MSFHDELTEQFVEDVLNQNHGELIQYRSKKDAKAIEFMTRVYRGGEALVGGMPIEIQGFAVMVPRRLVPLPSKSEGQVYLPAHKGQKPQWRPVTDYQDVGGHEWLVTVV